MIVTVRLISTAGARRIAYAETVGEVEAAIATVEREIGRARWRPVGDVPRNNGTVEMGRDAATQIIERFVNGCEACLELEALRSGEIPSSPYEAARRWFGVPVGGLAAIADDRLIRRLAEQTVQVL